MGMGEKRRASFGPKSTHRHCPVEKETKHDTVQVLFFSRSDAERFTDVVVTRQSPTELGKPPKTVLS